MAKMRRNDAPLYQGQPANPYSTATLPESAAAARLTNITTRIMMRNLPSARRKSTPKKHAQKNAEARKKKRGDLLYTIAMIVFAAIFLISGGLLVKRFLDDRKTESEFADLQSMIDTAATPAPAGENVNPNGARFAALRDKNSDFIGWISIDGTKLDFPVMYAPDNKDFYLRHDFNKTTASTACRTWTKRPRWVPTPRAEPYHLRPQYEDRHNLRLPDRVQKGRLLSGAPLH